MPPSKPSKRIRPSLDTGPHLTLAEYDTVMLGVYDAARDEVDMLENWFEAVIHAEVYHRMASTAIWPLLLDEIERDSRSLAPRSRALKALSNHLKNFMDKAVVDQLAARA